MMLACLKTVGEGNAKGELRVALVAIKNICIFRSRQKLFVFPRFRHFFYVRLKSFLMFEPPVIPIMKSMMKTAWRWR